jgi:hypothetical protein
MLAVVQLHDLCRDVRLKCLFYTPCKTHVRQRSGQTPLARQARSKSETRRHRKNRQAWAGCASGARRPPRRLETEQTPQRPWAPRIGQIGGASSYAPWRGIKLSMITVRTSLEMDGITSFSDHHGSYRPDKPAVSDLLYIQTLHPGHLDEPSRNTRDTGRDPIPPRCRRTFVPERISRIKSSSPPLPIDLGLLAFPCPWPPRPSASTNSASARCPLPRLSAIRRKTHTVSLNRFAHPPPATRQTMPPPRRTPRVSQSSRLRHSRPATIVDLCRAACASLPATRPQESLLRQMAVAQPPPHQPSLRS